MLSLKTTIAIVSILCSNQSTAALSFRQSRAEENSRSNRIIDVCSEEDVCSERLGLLTKYSVRWTSGDTCRTECTFFPLVYRLSGYECGACQCNAVWQCGDVRTICGKSGSENCLCSLDTESKGYCWVNDSCNRETCTSSSDCSGEDRCVPGNCCSDEGTGICLSPCPVSNIDLDENLDESNIFREQGQSDVRRPGGNY